MISIPCSPVFQQAAQPVLQYSTLAAVCMKQAARSKLRATECTFINLNYGAINMSLIVNILSTRTFAVLTRELNGLSGEVVSLLATLLL